MLCEKENNMLVKQIMANQLALMVFILKNVETSDKESTALLTDMINFTTEILGEKK